MHLVGDANTARTKKNTQNSIAVKAFLHVVHNAPKTNAHAPEGALYPQDVWREYTAVRASNRIPSNAAEKILTKVVQL